MPRKSRSPWLTQDSGFPPEEVRSAQLEHLVRYAVLAPSTHNTQPWLFRVRGNALELIADRSRALPVVDPDRRELTISCGAALQFARIAARNLAREASVEVLPDAHDPDLLARLRLGARSSPTAGEIRRFNAIPQRHTNRTALASGPELDSLITTLGSLARRYGVSFRASAEKEVRRSIATLVATADHRQMSDPAFRHELSNWVRSTKSRAHDGMSLSSFGLHDWLSAGVAIALDQFDLSGATAEKHHKLMLQAPWVAMLATPQDNPASWLRTGIALADILLEITARGLAYSFANQPIEMSKFRPRIARVMHSDEHPQMLMRIGAGVDVPAAARRAAEQVTVIE